MENFERHITNKGNRSKAPLRTSFCGKKIENGEWTFSSIEHLFDLSAQKSNKLWPCAKCKVKIIELLYNLSHKEYDNKGFSEITQMFTKETQMVWWRSPNVFTKWLEKNNIFQDKSWLK